MANLGPFRAGPQPGIPTPPRGTTIARYGTYMEAQRAVDFLSDAQFPVQFVTIVGSGLQMVERVTGRLTYGRVAVAGSLSGAWFGLFVGLLLSLFSEGQVVGILGAVLIGAAFGMLFGVISYAATRGRRDFTSTSQIVASEYQVLCAEEHAGQALQLLRRLPGGEGRGGPTPTAPATVTPAPPEATGSAAPPVSEPSAQAEAAPSGQDQPTTQVVTGPTYGEMIDRRRREEREQQQRELGEQAREREQQEERARQERQERDAREAETRPVQTDIQTDVQTEVQPGVQPDPPAPGSAEGHRSV